MKKYAAPLLSVILASCAPAAPGIQSMLRGSDGSEITVREITGANSVERFISRDGAVFIEFGADSCLVADFREGARTFAVTVIAFLDAKGAKGAYEFSRSRNTSRDDAGGVVPGDGADARFVKGNCVVSVRPGAGADAESAVAFSKTLARRIPGPLLATELYTPLPVDDLIRGSACYFMGPKAFSARIDSGLADALRIGSAIEGVAGKYRLPGGGEATLVKARFASHAQVMEALRGFIASREETTPVARPANNTNYYTLFNSGNTELYIAEYADWLVFMPDGPRGGAARQLFEFALRSM